MNINEVKIKIQKQEHGIQPGLIAGRQLLDLAQLQGSQQLLFEAHNDIDIPILEGDFIIIEGGEEFSIGDGEPPIEENPCLRKPVKFHFNGEKVSDELALKRPKVLGSELKALDPDGQAGDGLFADIDGLADEPIRDDQRIHVKKGDRFITTPCGNVGYQKEGLTPLSTHFEELKADFPLASLHAHPPGHALMIKDFPLPGHWSNPSADILIAVPDGYPLAALDMFYVSPGITLTDGRIPKGAEHHQPFLGQSWQRFSWHYQSRQWNPAQDSLLTHVRFCNIRLSMVE